MKDQKRTGTVLSYINIFLSMSINVILTPMLITACSDETYSLYKIIQSFVGPLAVFSFGLSGMTTRYIAKFRVSEDKNTKETENVLAMLFIVALVMAAIVFAISCLMCPLISKLYGAAYSKQQIDLAKSLFFIFSLSASISIITEFFRGCIDGYELFTVHYGTNILHSVIKLFGSLWCIYHGANVRCVAAIGLIDNVVMLSVLATYTLFSKKERFYLYKWDGTEFRYMLVFASAAFLQAVVNQVNNNLDITILGVFVEEKKHITMYSSALAIFSIYNSLLSVIAGIFFPKTVFEIEKKQTGEELTDFLIVPGRMQTTIAVGVLCGFALFGKEFIRLWIGSSYEDAYLVALILMIPVTIPLVQNVCLNVLDAKLKRMFRSVVLCVMAGINLVLSIYLVKIFDFWGAAFGTAFSLMLGHGIIMNIYYQKKININVCRMFREMFRGIAKSGALASLICLPFVGRGGSSVWCFIFKCIAFCVIYAIMLWFMGWNKSEKKLIMNIWKRSRN